MDAGTRPAVEAEDERPRKTARVVSPEALAALEVENTTIQADLNAMRGEVTLLRRQVLLLSRTPPSAESSIAVVSRLLHGELQAAIKKERGNRERLSVDNLAAYSASEWLESLTGVMPTLRAVILAMGLPWGRVEEGGEPNTNNRVKRLVAVTSAVSSLMHSLNLNFCSVLGHLQSFSVYSITGSPAAVQVAFLPSPPRPYAPFCAVPWRLWNARFVSYRLGRACACRRRRLAVTEHLGWPRSTRCSPRLRHWWRRTPCASHQTRT